MEMVELYRAIGKTLHELGAYRAVIIRAKATPNTSYEMNLEIAVDGAIDVRYADKICAEKWPNMCIRLLDLNDYDNIELMNEVIEDGIKI